uniref:39S ribosomal protein L37, mitochondrial n=1 Tax=Rhabditophanes sp. KR3021 TaxID=114890 RepID=A0AC35U8Z4_9BILA
MLLSRIALRGTASSKLEYIAPPNYRRTTPPHEARNIIQEEFMPEADRTGTGPRLADYLSIRDMVLTLETPQDKIDFVNPYERQWNRIEKTWHRSWHPALYATRKAWNLPLVPKYFDCQNYYQYITKMRLINDKESFDQLFKGLNLPTKAFGLKLEENLVSHLFTESSDSPKERTDKLLRSIMYDCHNFLGARNNKYGDLRVSMSPRSESFWVRGGFKHLYDWMPIWADKPISNLRYAPKFTGDDRRKLGELAFTMRDEFAVHLRQKTSPNPLFKLDDQAAQRPIFSEDTSIEDVVYSPRVFNLWPDGDPLWQCPGYESDCNETHKYGRVAFKNTITVNDQLDKWNLDGEVEKETYNCIAISSLFNWLNGQAHCQGYTQYTDLDRPFVSNLVMSDGVQFAFATAQLNTLAINVDLPEFVNDRSNVCYVDGPYKLYDEFDDQTTTFYHHDKDGKKQKGLNSEVLNRILQLVVKD